MAVAGTVTIEHEVRPCIISRNLKGWRVKALFHNWVTIDGEVKALVEVVEDEAGVLKEGEISYVIPNRLTFTDHKGREYHFGSEEG